MLAFAISQARKMLKMKASVMLGYAWHFTVVTQSLHKVELPLQTLAQTEKTVIEEDYLLILTGNFLKTLTNFTTAIYLYRIL